MTYNRERALDRLVGDHIILALGGVDLAVRQWAINELEKLADLEELRMERGRWFAAAPITEDALRKAWRNERDLYVRDMIWTQAA